MPTDNSHTYLPTLRLPAVEQHPSSVRERLSNFLRGDSSVDNNLGSFTNHVTGDDAEALTIQNYGKNLANSHEYPALSELHKRCVCMLSEIWNAPQATETVGHATTGSSEAILLAGLTMKRLWLRKGLSCRPNLIVGNHAHLAIDKFANICDVDLKKIPISVESNFCFDTTQLEDAVNEGTIGVLLILGNTYTGHFDAVKEVSYILDDVQKSRGLDVRIHVDAASGGFVAPFTNLERSQWDFSIPRVTSINASGHKFGLTSPAIGWIIWRDQAHVPKEMYHTSNYLSGSSESVTACFSQSGSRVIEQYLALSTLGSQGFTRLVKKAFGKAARLAHLLEESGWFQCVNSYVHSAGAFSDLEAGGIPLVVFTYSQEFRQHHDSLTEAWLADELRKEGYMVPHYTLPTIASDVTVLRIVVRLHMGDSQVDEIMGKVKRIMMRALADHEGSGIAMAKL